MADDDTVPTPDGAEPEDGSGGPAPPNPSIPGPAPRPRGRRFVVSQLLARYGDRVALRRDMVDLFSMRLQRSVLASVDVVSDVNPEATPTGRRVVVVDADPAELAGKLADLTEDAVVEPEKPRRPCVVDAADSLGGFGADRAEAPRAGEGSDLRLKLRGPDMEPIGGALVVVQLVARLDATVRTSVGGVSDAAGAVVVSYDPDVWLVTLAAVIPRDSYWAMPVASPQNGQTIRLTPLPRNGPFGWWQLLSGAARFDPAAGQGIGVGVIDTGVGPHPFLEHVVPVGAFVDGGFIAGAAAGRDASGHGTHVAGLIGARPAPTSGQYGGVAPGAMLRVARVFSPGRPANQGDTANAISYMSAVGGADILNLSFAGEYSEIERDAVIVARSSGTLCVGSAGNSDGSPVAYPAAYPECAAVSALGLLATYPPGATAASYVPSDSRKVTASGLFLASFSNVGPNLACTAAGSAVISTAPAADGAPYAEMSGTSMASPLAVGALAVALSQDPQYRAMPRTADRAAYAAEKLLAGALPVGLAPIFEGRGLARAGRG